MPQRQPFKPSDLFRLNTLAEVQLAPDGRRVAYTQTRVDRDEDAYRSRIYVASTEGGRPIRWTNGPQKDSQPRWSPDGRYLAFVRELPDQKPQLYLMPTGGGEACRVTESAHGVNSPAWSPDGRRLAFVTATGEADLEEPTPAEKNQPRVVDRLAYRQDGIGYFDACRSHIWVVEVDNFDPDRLPAPHQITDGDWNDTYPCWSPDGREIAFVSYREPERLESVFLRGDIWAVAAEGGEARKLTRSRGPAAQPCWSPDGSMVAYAGHELGYDNLARTIHLNVVPAGGGEPRSITAALDRTLIGPPAFPPTVYAWMPDGRGLAFIAMDRGNMTIFHADLEGNIRTLSGGNRQVTGLSLAANGRHLVFTAHDPTSHTEVYSLDMTSGEERRLTHANQVLADEIELGRTERIRWTGADGLEIEGWVLKPAGFVEGRRYPTVLEVHGGPHGQYGTAFTPGFHAMAGAGYLVIYANPRGSTGYGEDFTLMCVDDWGGKDFEDLMRGVDHVVSLGWADPDRLCVAGYSYGGFMTTWIVGHTTRFKAAVAGACVSNAYSFWGTSDIGTGFGQYEYGGAMPHEMPEHYLAGSPVQHLVNCETPLLLLHHEGDLRCPIGQSEEVFAALKKLGKEAVLVRYPGGYHTYATHAPSQRVDAIQRMNDWFDRFVGTEA